MKRVTTPESDDVDMGMYKSIVCSILTYGSEVSNLTEQVWKALNGVHHHKEDSSRRGICSDIHVQHSKMDQITQVEMSGVYHQDGTHKTNKKDSHADAHKTSTWRSVYGHACFTQLD